MSENEALATIGIVGEWIWGDDEETKVFAQAYGNGRTLIFQFKQDTTNPRSLASRLVTCYHDIDVSDPTTSFSDRPSMRTALWSAVASIWQACIDDPITKGFNVVIDVLPSDQITWKAVWRDHLDDFLSHLLPIDQVTSQESPQTIPFEELVRYNQLGGRGCSTLVSAPSTAAQYVFKGVDYRVYLLTYESHLFEEEVKTLYRSIKLLEHIPRHPNIQPAPSAFVTLCKPGHPLLVCGTLEPFYSNGTLNDQIETANSKKLRIPIQKKIQWCYEMALAIAHMHLVAHTYHMDIKPGNFLLGPEDHVVLIDWDQNDAPVTTAAPEIDGTWDAEQHGDSVTYVKYTGPERRNMPECTPGCNGWNVWNSLQVWVQTCPKAAELAEVFSVGRTMWMLLRQPDTDYEDVESTWDIVEDWNGCEDVPHTIKTMVDRCVEHDRNKRPTLDELVNFWARQHKLSQNSI